MSHREISVFLEELSAAGDDWSAEDALQLFGGDDLQEALSERFSLLRSFSGVLSFAE